MRYTADEIAELTSLSKASISPSIGILEPIEPPIRKNIYNLYHRTVYSDLRKVGASAVEARRYRSLSVAHVLARLDQRSELINDLALSRLEQYSKYLRIRGEYVSEADTLARLRESIAKAMGRSKIPSSKFDYDSYPTLSYGELQDDF